MHSNSQKMLRRMMLVGTLAFLVGCSDKPTQPGKTPTLLQIIAPAFSIFSGGTLQLSAIVSFADGTTGDVTAEASWSILPGHAGTMHEAGLFVATNNSTGVETVRVDYQGQTVTVQIEVTVRARTLAIWPVTTTVESGGHIQFEAFAEFQDANQAYITEKVIWSLAQGDIASIDSSGLFRSIQGLTGRDTVTGKFQMLTTLCQVQVQETLENPFEMVPIPAGSFIMGDDSSQWANEKPAHEVYTGAFEISKYEITNEQYAAYLNEALNAGEIYVEAGIVTGRKGPFAWLTYLRLSGSPQFPERYIEYVEVDPGIFKYYVTPGFEQYPVVRLNWYGAAAFCSFYGLRLPTEAEWEKACHGGQQLEYGTPDGSNSHDLANYAGVGGGDIYEGLAPIRSFLPNSYDLYDMSGNAAEYVFDVYDANYYSVSPTTNPAGPGPVRPIGRLSGGVALWRGGSWLFNPQLSRSAFRGYIDDLADTNLLINGFVGFRVARSLP